MTSRTEIESSVALSNASTTSAFCLLPNELKLNIVDRLPHPSRINLMNTNRQWHAAFADPRYWAIQDFMWVGNDDLDARDDSRLALCHWLSSWIQKAFPDLTQVTFPCSRWTTDMLAYVLPSRHGANIKALCVELAKDSRDQFRLATICDMFNLAACAQKLQRLHLEGVRLILPGNDIIPSGFGKFVALKQLVLRECLVDIDGALPPNLEELALLRNVFAGHTLVAWPATTLHKLRSLSVSVNEGDWSINECTLLLSKANLEDNRIMDIDLTIGYDPDSNDSETWHPDIVQFFETYGHRIKNLTTSGQTRPGLEQFIHAVNHCRKLDTVTFANSQLFGPMWVEGIHCFLPRPIMNVTLQLCRTLLNEQLEQGSAEAWDLVRRLKYEWRQQGPKLVVCPKGSRWPEHFDVWGWYDGPVATAEEKRLYKDYGEHPWWAPCDWGYRDYKL